MATINLDKLFDISNLEEGYTEFDSKKYQGLIDETKNHRQMEGKTGEAGDYLYIIASEDTENYKKGDLVVTVEAGKFVVVKDYLKSNGKSKFNLLVGSDYTTELPIYGDVVRDSVVDNPIEYNAEYAGMYDKKGNVISSLTTTAFNDIVDLSGFQAEDAEEDAYIKKGFTVKTAQGDDQVKGSVLNDTVDTGAGDDIVTASAGNDKYTLGAGENTASYDMTKEFGNDTYNLTKKESLTVDFGTSYAPEKHSAGAYVKGNDVVVDKYSKTKVVFTETTVEYSKKAETAVYTSKQVLDVDDTAKAFDLKVVRDGASVTKIKGYTEAGYVELTNEGLLEQLTSAIESSESEGSYITLVKTGENYVVVEDGDVAPEEHYALSGADATDGAACKLANVKEGLYVNGTGWQYETGYDVYAADAEVVAGDPTYYMTVGLVEEESDEDYTQAEGFNANTKYFVKTLTDSTYIPSDNPEEEGEWEQNMPVNTLVTKKDAKAGTTYYETVLGADGTTVLAEYNLGSKEPKDELLALASNNVKFNYIDEALNSIVIKNAAKGVASNIEIKGLGDDIDVLNDAFNNIEIPTKVNKINGTALGDVVELTTAYDEDGTGYVVNTGAGNDVITGSAGDDTFTTGAGINKINITNTADFGDDVVNLTKGETLTVDFATDLDFENGDAVSVDGKDVVITNGENGTVTFKGLAAKDLVGEAGAILVDENTHDVRELAKHDVTLNNKTTKFSTAYLGAVVDVAEDTTKALTVDLSKSQYANTVDLSNAKGKVTVKGGSAGDTVTAGAGDDTFTLGKGTNTLTNAGLGKDIVNLTKDETLNVTLANALVDWQVVKNDVVLVTDTDEETGAITGSVTFKNFAAKDPQAIVNIEGNDPSALKDFVFTTKWDDTNPEEVDAGTDILTSKTKSFTGSRLNDVVDASEFTLYNGEEAIEVVEEPDEFDTPKPKRSDFNTKEEYNAALAAYNAELAAYKAELAEYNTYAKAKGVTIDAKDGENVITGSIYADTIKAGKDDDTVVASAGNDTYTLGAGTNTVDYTAGAGVDTFNLTKDETLALTELANDAVFTKNGNDIVVVNTENSQIVLKNLAAGKTNAEVYIGEYDPENPGDNVSIWDQDIIIGATSAKVTGTLGNDKFTSDRAAGTTFVESYTATTGFNNENEITVDLGEDVVKKAADTIQITTSDKAADKLSAYNFDYNYNAGTLTVGTEKGNISYTSEDYSKGLNLIDATGAKWAFHNDTIEGVKFDLTKLSTNNIVQVDANSDLILDSKKNDIIISKGKEQAFVYTAGKDLYSSEVENSDDTYVVDLDKKTTLVVSDNAGDNVLSLNDKDTYVRYFNVDLTANTDYTTDLVILDTATFFDKNGDAIVKSAKTIGTEFAAGTVVLKDAVAVDSEVEETSVSNFTISHGTASNDYTVAGIQEAVADWLTASGYDSSAAVFEAGVKDDIQDLMAVYATGTYTA